MRRFDHYTAEEVIQGLLFEYQDELSKEACDNCEHCGDLVMCSFHSILSCLSGETGFGYDVRRFLEEARKHKSHAANKQPDP